MVPTLVLALLMAACGAPGAGDTDKAKVGFVFSQSGLVAAYGKSQRNGAQLAIDEINAAAGNGGTTISAIFEDDASTPEQGIKAFRKLIDRDKVSLIIGPTLSTTAMATDPTAQEAGVPVLGVSTTIEGITEIGDMIFRNSLTETVVIPNTVSQAKDQLGLEKVAIMYERDDGFTRAGYDVFKRALQEQGIEITSEQTFTRGDRDFSAQLRQIKSEAPDAVVVSAFVQEAAGIIKQARQLGIPNDVAFIGGNSFNSPILIQKAGDAAEGVIVGTAWHKSLDTPHNQQFVQTYTEKFGSPPDQFAAQAYAGVKLVHEALVRADSTDRKAIRDALAQLQSVETVLGTFTFTEGRDAQHKPVVQQVQGGKFVVFGE
jgi:branched-chain amino acid transport system substrate-binding protein